MKSLSFRSLVLIVIAAVFLFLSLFIVLRHPRSQSLVANAIYINYPKANISLLKYGFGNFLLHVSKTVEIKNYSGQSSSSDVKSIIENYDVTTLPSFVIKNISAVNITLLPYYFLANLFNLVTINSTTAAVLNTPFISTITGNVTFYSIIYNQTIFDKYISNPSLIFNNVQNASNLAYLTIFLETNQTPQHNIYVIVGNDSYSAAGLDLLDIALSNFGNLSGNLQYSSSMPLGSISLGPVQYLYPSKFDSNYFSLTVLKLNNVGINSAAFNALLTYDLNALNPAFSQIGFLPFVDIGNKFIGYSSPIRPYLLNNYSYSQLSSMVQSNQTSQLAEALRHVVYFYDAMLCDLINTSRPAICSTPAVSAYYSLIS